MRCLDCHYELKNLTPIAGVHRCPECGRAFDPIIETTFDGPESRRLREEMWVKRSLVIIPSAFAVFGIAMALIVGDLKTDEIIAMFAVVVPCAVGWVGLLLFLHWRSRRKEPAS